MVTFIDPDRGVTMSIRIAARSALVLCLGAAVSAVPTPATAQPSLSWGTCPPAVPGQFRHPRLECATVRVPVDYRRPHAAQLTVTISRIPAASATARRGVLLTNPGGPAERGLDYPGKLTFLMSADVLDRYDLIGMDPRGVGESSPISCGIDPATPSDLVLPYPAPDGSIARNIAHARATAAGCAEHAGSTLAHITTANTARDMDVIRAALGERRISYFGASYGTYLGTVYRALFPHRVDRMVLDSAIDPRLVWRDTWRSWNVAIPARLPDFTGWLAARDDTYRFGANTDEVTRRYLALVDRMDRDPVVLPDGSAVNGNQLREVTRALLFDDVLFPVLADVWRAFDAGHGVPIASPVDDNFASVFYAISCNDVAWPRNPFRYAIDVAVDRHRSPLMVGMPANIWPCAFWPNRPVEPPVAVTGGGRRNVLILHQTRDPAVPLSAAQGLRTVLGRAAVLITVDGGGHLAFGRGSCADAITTTFLRTATLPAHDQACAAPPSAT
jgi:pimeloyl-ACP methyl ester carboxylesterase